MLFIFIEIQQSSLYVLLSKYKTKKSINKNNKLNTYLKFSSLYSALICTVISCFTLLFLVLSCSSPTTI